MNSDTFKDNNKSQNGYSFEEHKKYMEKKEFERYCGIFWLYMIPLAALVAGCVCLPIGLRIKGAIKTMDADVDFKLLDQSCPIVGSDYFRTKQITGDKGKHTGCEDVYLYTFSADQLSDEDAFYESFSDFEFKTYEHKIRRSCNSCNRCDMAPPLYTVGEEAQCWRPTVPDVESDEGKISSWYRCGNEECIKILSPQWDEDRARGYAKGYTIAGIVCLSSFLPLLALVYCISICCCAKEDESMDWEHSDSKPNTNPGESTVVPEQSHQQQQQAVPAYTVSSPSYAPEKKDENNAGGGTTSLFDQMNSRV